MSISASDELYAPESIGPGVIDDPVLHFNLNDGVPINVT
jgi:hypothetical protein